MPRLEKILRMGASEIAVRSWQAAAKRLDRIATATAGGPRAPREATQLPGAAAELLLQRFREAGPERFFAGTAGEDAARHIAAQASGERDWIVASADLACRRRFDLLGYRSLSFGDPIDWHLDPVAGVRAPALHWSRIDPLDRARVGDSKVTWELNRHQWMVDLAQAYAHSGDERYATTFAGDLTHWMQANPPGIGINWASSLEVAYRLIAWCWALVLFRGSPAVTPQFFARVLAWIGAHAAHVERFLSYYYSPNTHLTGEALGLFYAGTAFPELRGAQRWRELGHRILLAQLERQVLADGTHFEQSTHYQRYIAETYLHFLILAARNGIAVPAAAGERVQRVLDVLLALRRPDGSLAAIGDADGGWVLPLAHRLASDTRGLFAVAAAWFGRADYAAAGQATAPELPWLLGPAGVDALRKLRPAAAPTASLLLPAGGYALMCSGGAHRLIFDVGPLGCPVSGAHGHADLLAIQCDAFGSPVLVDAGTYCYTADARWREHFRGSAAHNTVTVDGLSQAATAGPFSWRARPRARLRRWVSCGAFDLADADHDAYGGLTDPVTHRRRVFFRKPLYWLVVDDLAGRAAHRVDLRFQFAPMPVMTEPGPWVRARAGDEGELLVRAFAAVPLRTELVEGGLDPIAGWVSADYGQREPAPVLTCSVDALLPLRVVTVLMPVRGAAPAPRVQAGEADGRFHLLFEDLREAVHIDADDIVVHGLQA
jgi:uncharacterized heparinase superfamily protein